MVGLVSFPLPVHILSQSAITVAQHKMQVIQPKAECVGVIFMILQ